MSDGGSTALQYSGKGKFYWARVQIFLNNHLFFSLNLEKLMNKIIFKKVNLPADVDFSIWNKMLLEADFISLLFGCNRRTLYTVHCSPRLLFI